VLVRSANFTLHHVARLPTTDASNGFRMFSRRVIDRIEVESRQGFCYSIELLVKAHRLGWTVAEVPVTWIERPERRKPLPGSQVAAGIFALVRLRLRHHLLAAAAAHGHA